MNNFQITGTITADAEIKKVGDSNVINFSIANNDESKKKEDGSYETIASFFNVVYWSKSGKMVTHLLKGKQVTICGTLKQERWEKDGVKNSRVTLRATEVLPHKFEAASQSNNNDTSFEAGFDADFNSSSESGVPF